MKFCSTFGEHGLKSLPNAGERDKYSWPIASFLEHNITIAFGSDWFVAPPSPLKGIYAAVTRSTLDSKHLSGWIPEQKISVEQALKAYTVGACYASFDERIKGEIKEGYLADFVVLDKDLTNINPRDIWNTSVLYTILDGKIVYSYPNPFQK